MSSIEMCGCIMSPIVLMKDFRAINSDLYS